MLSQAFYQKCICKCFKSKNKNKKQIKLELFFFIVEGSFFSCLLILYAFLSIFLIYFQHGIEYALTGRPVA